MIKQHGTCTVSLSGGQASNPPPDQTLYLSYKQIHQAILNYLDQHKLLANGFYDTDVSIPRDGSEPVVVKLYRCLP